MRDVSITAWTLALAFGVTACGQKSDDAKSAAAGEGTAYSTTTHTTKQADAAPGSLRASSIPDNPGAPNPQATTGGAAGGMTQATPVVPDIPTDSGAANRAAATRAGTTNQTPKGAPADGRVDPR